jgi:hypothetical protein
VCFDLGLDSSDWRGRQTGEKRRKNRGDQLNWEKGIERRG